MSREVRGFQEDGGSNFLVPQNEFSGGTVCLCSLSLQATILVKIFHRFNTKSYTRFYEFPVFNIISAMEWINSKQQTVRFIKLRIPLYWSMKSVICSQGILGYCPYFFYSWKVKC